LKPKNNVGILGYGAYIPLYRIRAEEIGKVWGKSSSFPIIEKAVAGIDEDVITISAEAAKYALRRAGISPSELGAILIGTESKPYAVKPSSTVIASIINSSSKILSADYEFACKAGTEAFQSSIGLVSSGMVNYALAIGADTAQGRPNDNLEYTAASGGAAYIFSSFNRSDMIARIEYSYSYVSDTPDFWRRQGEKYPRHTGRFTGEPAYFHHIISSVKGILEESGYSLNDFDYCVFHQPNTKFPLRVAKKLGIPREKIEPGLLSPIIGNTYAGAVPLGLAAVLDIAEPESRILVSSFGSGAGSDSFIISVLDSIESKRNLAPTVQQLIQRKKYITYSLYAKYRDKISM